MGVTQFASQFWRLSVWSLESLLYLPPLLVLVSLSSVSTALAFRRQRPFQSPLWKKSHWFVLTQLLFFPVLISIGVLFPGSGPSFYHAVSTATRVHGLLGWLSLALAAFWVYRMKGFRWFAVSVVMLLEVILMGAFVVTGMAVTGDWL